MQNLQTYSSYKPVFLDMDGGIDDLISLTVLLTLKKIRLIGVSVTNGNCFSDNAVESILRILGMLKNNETEVAVSNASAVNEFPDKWRENTKRVNQIELLKQHKADYSKLNPEEASDFTAKKILSEEGPTTVILTGPATNLVNTIEKYPEVKGKIDKIYWMAGAFLANGNVIAPDHDESAEWNIFWDPFAARKLFSSKINITLFPLDACCQVPVDNYVLYCLKEQAKQPLFEFVLKMIELTYHEHSKYYLWDLLPTMCLAFPDIAHISNTSVDVELRGTSVGNIFKTSKGFPIFYASMVDDEKFYDYLFQQLRDQSEFLGINLIYA